MELIIKKLKAVNDKSGFNLFLQVFDNGSGDLLHNLRDVTFDSFNDIDDLHKLLDDELEDLENDIAGSTH